MTNFDERVRYLFGLDIEFKISQVDLISSSIARASQRLVDCLLSDGRILICGSGGSSANSLHFSQAMLNHFDVERPPLPVLNLTTDIASITAITNDGHFDQIFAKQIQALGQSKDVLVVLSTTGKSNIILEAITAAHDNDMDVIALNGRDGGLIANHLGPEDIEIRIQSDSKARILEMHLFILHCFCDLIDSSLFSHE
ncbi:MAG: phosphoheptose isomerase [Legionellales bacterium RIFCSPHIGHO2_12_FULL_35_11]|nr:MAG: phosphoheptose isomerase [Legionellales bacterium RIFCSPHIGHO2_12_FULL_35_11]